MSTSPYDQHLDKCEAIYQPLTPLTFLERAAYVAKATMSEQRVVRDLRAVGGERGDCFAMVIVARGDRSGALIEHGREASSTACEATS